MNNFFRWGMIPALLVIVACGVIAVRVVFVEDADVAVPNLVGTMIWDAAESLQQQGLLAKVDKVESSQPTGMVISQHIEPGERVGKGKVVLIKVSKGGERSSVPDVRGLEYGEAVKRLVAAGFKVGNTLRVMDSLKPAGSVIAQNPAAPALLSGNYAVQLLVCEGKEGEGSMLFVPNLKGYPLDRAKDMLDQSGLSLDKIITVPSETVPEGSIVSSVPKDGARIPAGGRIILNVARIPDEDKTKDSTEIKETQETEERPVPSERQPVLSASKTEKKKEEPRSDTIRTESPNTGKQGGSEKQEKSPSEPVVSPVTSLKKVAKVRYQVPPLSKPLNLKIEFTDANGKKVLEDKQVNGTEYITMDVPFSGEARVSVYLGGDFIWQDKFE